MGATGSDVAREAADLVLLDDHIATIVTAVKLGRATFSNICRFLTYHLTDNVAELAPFLLWGLTGGTFPVAGRNHAHPTGVGTGRRRHPRRADRGRSRQGTAG
jgi:hypothetical protein